MNERNDIYQFDDAEIAANPIVERMIRDAVAARDTEIREALEYAYDEFRCENTDGMGGRDQYSTGYLEGLSFALGLAEEGKMLAIRREPAADAVERDLGSVLRTEYARGYGDAKREQTCRTYSVTSVNESVYPTAAVQPEPGLDVDKLAVDVQVSLNEYTKSKIVVRDGKRYIEGYEPEGELEAIRGAIANAVAAAKKGKER